MAKKRTIIKPYKTYMFKDKDPVIDVVRTMMNGSSYAKVSRDSGVSATTLGNWFGGNTCRPQFATVQAVAHSLGQTFKAVRK